VTADHYRVLGVAPGAEDAVIRAAYRALMRMYHPDTNDDPRAQSRVREITAAFAVLGDPERRAAYDARQIFGGAGAAGERAEFAADRRSPPMRAAGLASIAVAIAVTLAFALPKSQQALEPQSLRNLAAYRGITDAAPPSAPAARPPSRSADSAVVASGAPAPPPLAVPPPAPAPRAVSEPPRDRALPAPIREVASVERKAPVAVTVQPKANPVPKPAEAPTCPQCSDRRAQVERLAASFLKQSLEHSDWQKQQLLLSARNRAATSRTMCRSDDCVTEAYLRQIRDTTMIMEGRIPNP